MKTSKSIVIFKRWRKGDKNSLRWMLASTPEKK